MIYERPADAAPFAYVFLGTCARTTVRPLCKCDGTAERRLANGLGLLQRCGDCRNPAVVDGQFGSSGDRPLSAAYRHRIGTLVDVAHPCRRRIDSLLVGMRLPSSSACLPQHSFVKCQSHQAARSWHQEPRPQQAAARHLPLHVCGLLFIHATTSQPPSLCSSAASHRAPTGAGYKRVW